VDGEDDLEELVREIAFDDGVSYNLVETLLQEEVPLQRRTDYGNCLAVVDGMMAFWPDQTMREVNCCILSEKKPSKLIVEW
jgi:hypothetical protein